MSTNYKIVNARIINENRCFSGTVTVADGMISSVEEGNPSTDDSGFQVIDASGLLLMPGVIDCHVHFREPGLTHKADMASESRAAVAGGVTSFMEMPNTLPQTTTIDLLEQKFELASQKSLANYSFFLGATNDNISEIEKLDASNVCGVKIFFGASTGNMLVDNAIVLEQLFERSPVLIAAHCEDEAIIQRNLQKMKVQFGDEIPVAMHPQIRSEEACVAATERAVNLARKHHARLHITHVTTSKELDFLNNETPIEEKRITAETCTHYLSFCDENYAQLGMRLKVNPAVKTLQDQEALLNGLINGKIDLLATDHAPHLLSEKNQPYIQAPSGAPMVQHSLAVMLEMWKARKISIEKVVEKMCHAPALCYKIDKRGFIRKGYYADLVLVNPNVPWTVSEGTVLHKCGWSIFDGFTFSNKIEKTFVNGNLVYDKGNLNENFYGKRLTFNP